MDALQRQFEKWASAEGLNLKVDDPLAAKPGVYISHYTAVTWLGYQAGHERGVMEGRSAQAFDELVERDDAIRKDERNRLYENFRCSPCAGGGLIQTEPGNLVACEMCGGVGIKKTIETWNDFEDMLR